MKVTAETGRYIKLGRQGCWESLCLRDGTLRLGYYEAPHEAALSGNRDKVRQAYAHKTAGAATAHATQVLQFYDPSDQVIWITFSDDSLWWCKAGPAVEFLGDDRDRFTCGSRLRRVIGAWSNQSIHGRPLEIRSLNGELAILHIPHGRGDD